MEWNGLLVTEHEWIDLWGKHLYEEGERRGWLEVRLLLVAL